MISLFNKKWESKKLDAICVLKNGYNFSKGSLEDGLKVINVFDFKDRFSPNYSELENLIADKLPSSDFLLKKNDIVFVRSNGNKELVGRTMFIDEEPFPITFSAFCIRARPKDDGLHPKYLAYFFKSEVFKSKLQSSIQGTYIGNISQALLSQIYIPLPPLEEQLQIATLFGNIEESIAMVVAQEKRLRNLQGELSKGLATTSPAFGNLLQGEVCTPVTVGDIAICIKKVEPDPLANGISRFVGLEHIEPESFTLNGWGDVEKGTTFTKRFAKGDVLFGKRRAYLKKVAVADFDGICSGDILVLRANAERILPQLLPYYASAEPFIAHAVSTSAGSLSPRTKWKDLAEFELSIPSLSVQHQIASVFGALQDSIVSVVKQKEALKRLKAALLNEILG